MKCGIEIHQRLSTKNKLFCNCSTSAFIESPEKNIIRKLRAVSGELGEIDQAAIYEAIKGKEYIYQTFPSSTCLVELDDEPPHEINKEALEIALKVALMLNCYIPEEIHIMRKTVIDGSNTSGFQRTALIGIGTDKSFIETAEGKVRIKDINLEEESAGIVEILPDSKIIYRLDRLGIPLIEIGTKADIKSASQAKEVALKIGMLLRSTGKAMRGIGTIRQDVNISVEGGARVEIKGLQEIDLIEKIIENEIKRQEKLIELKNFLLNSLEVKGPFDVTNIFKETQCRFISGIIKSGGLVYAISVKGLEGLLKTELCPGKTLGRELADYANAYGCKGIIHSDEDLKKYYLENEFKEISKLYPGAIIIIAEKKEIAEKTIKAVAERIKQLIVGVPEETRVACPDGTTKYTRPLPGGQRLYPETDLPPITINKKYLKKLSKNLPETWEEKLKKFNKILPKELSEEIIRSEYLEFFEKLYMKYDPKLVANTFISTIKELKRDGYEISNIAFEHFDEIFEMVSKKIIGKEAIPEIIKIISKNPNLKIEDAIKILGIEKISIEELEKIIKNIFNKYPDLYKEKKVSALMGEVMKEVRGKIDGAIVFKKLKEMIEK
ncbi:MAG: Glu-tRNA(Gln) amidotransferase subunit GatE [Candidatus Aenigmarchaeota archaeon]|nr:Glu-tRNA(Gln) amidotransferase subunit GatE [Candidatus Aenigmarchaeota archaeon]